MDQTPSSQTGNVRGPVALLLPLSGRLGDVGKPMAQAARLSLSAAGSPPMETKDTKGSPDDAAAAAQEAIAGGAKMILGPLTSAETARVAPIARAAGVPVLAFTNDQSQAQPGVWTLGITPVQQIRRLLAAVKDAGKEPVAALLPDTEFGRAMAEALIRTTAEANLPKPFIRTHGPGKAAVETAVGELAATATEGQPFPYGSILLGAVGGDLKLFAKAFSDRGIDRSRTQILGPALWADPAVGASVLTGAWFAMPDPAQRSDMAANYQEQYKTAPPPLADLAHDGASIARVLSAQGRMNAAGMTQAVGFSGVDGWVGFAADGQARRGLALFRVERQRFTPIGPAPDMAGKPGS